MGMPAGRNGGAGSKISPSNQRLAPVPSQAARFALKSLSRGGKFGVASLRLRCAAIATAGVEDDGAVAGVYAPQR